MFIHLKFVLLFEASTIEVCRFLSLYPLSNWENTINFLYVLSESSAARVNLTISGHTYLKSCCTETK